jgi:peptidyl-prolyl cis-trans isomerase C
MSLLEAASSIAPRAPRRRLPLLLLLAIVALPLLAGCSRQSRSSADAQASGAVIARVNGFEVREGHLAMAEEELGGDAELSQLPPQVKREHLLNYVIQVVLLAQAAEARKLQDTDDFRQRLAFTRSKLLMIQMLQANAKEAASDEALRRVYDEQVRPLGGTEEVRARHILFAADPKDEKSLAAAEAKARATLERIKAGEDFAALATELTDDPAGKKDGGDLGYFTKQQMVPEFANVAFQMFKGQVSNPVRTQFGYHIIKLEDRRTRPLPEFDTVRDRIAVVVMRQAQAALFKQLVEKAKIERLDKGPPSETASPPVAPPAEAAPPQEGASPPQGTPPPPPAPPVETTPQLEGGPVIKKKQ